MNTKYRATFAFMLGVIVTQAATGAVLAHQFGVLHARYAELYELAAYLAGKAEAAGVELEMEDRVSMMELKPG